MAVSPDFSRHAALITSNREDYSEIYHELSFPDTEAVSKASKLRQKLLKDIAVNGHSCNGGTKVYSGELSPGCKLCSEGSWSCLFINGRCNRSCFYCPTSQDEIGLPTTNNVTFRSPADYVAYLEQFNFRGMSLSGGEPTLTPGRCLAFMTAAKRKLGTALHSWLYTNGSLINEELLLKLRDAGLDEIRFDIGAHDYSLEKATLAVGIIPTVTVEIPAIPEKFEVLKERLAQMAESGIKHLNLHQLRLTNYNYNRLKGRPYTYLHGEKVTVLESELTALELIRYGLENKIALPINYCSFVYKHRYQRAAARGRGTELFQQGWEARTAAGYIRNLLLRGSAEHLQIQAERLKQADLDKTLWQLSRNGTQLQFAANLSGFISCGDSELQVTYSETPVKEHMSYRFPFRDIKLPSGRKICAERIPAKGVILESTAAMDFLNWLNLPGDHTNLHQKTALTSLAGFELLAPGLQEYF